ncbi:Alanine racemase, catabolic [Andreprevotia sp. IGB-42]|uniref:alanine racemase n=1 Tax=Andreprevotia sp. IGB-42 TaxID=2497473 RepID=UPI0013585CE6|nr:alanine racemase [Andreprevotia sp. IGB-42]KAF0811639.1 Alanine racemase, catabolic [Andreprevotia sp. IGB-42]
MPRPIAATIHTDALCHNYATLKARAPQARAFAVVKANAYGHGLITTAHALPDADGFATLEFPGALALRGAGVRQPILLLEGVFDADELHGAAQHDLWLSVHDEASLVRLEAMRLPAPVSVFLKLNTGMNRLGFPAEAAPALVARLQANPNVAAITLMAHFACADEAGKGIAAQMARFHAGTAGLALPVTLANSAATLAYPDTHADWVRPGIALYGASPFGSARSAASFGLLPVMTLASEIIAVQELAAGDAVGYGATFTATQRMRIGIVACGYADGYPRHAPSGTPLLVDGQRSQLVGRVSMDMLAVDISTLPAAGVGTAVELWGQALPVDEVAAAAGTIAYELTCAVAARVAVTVR